MTLELNLPRKPTCGALARRWLEERLTERLDAAVLDDVKLAVTELIDNAYRHGRGAISLRVDTGEDRIRLEVTDEGHGAAVHIREQGVESGGWGLRLVDRLALRWGAFEGTTHVWAELPASL